MYRFSSIAEYVKLYKSKNDKNQFEQRETCQNKEKKIKTDQ